MLGQNDGGAQHGLPARQVTLLLLTWRQRIQHLHSLQLQMRRGGSEPNLCTENCRVTQSFWIRVEHQASLWGLQNSLVSLCGDAESPCRYCGDTRQRVCEKHVACSVAAPRLRDQLVVSQAVVGALEGLAEQVLALQGLPLAPRHRAAQQLPQHPAPARYSTLAHPRYTVNTALSSSAWSIQRPAAQ